MTARHARGLGIYFGIFAALLVLTVTTVLVADAPLGRWHTAVALAIAVAKATLVVLFFMHALENSRLTWLVIGASLLGLAILFSLTLSDYITRPWMQY